MMVCEWGLCYVMVCEEVVLCDGEYVKYYCLSLGSHTKIRILQYFNPRIKLSNILIPESNYPIF